MLLAAMLLAVPVEIRQGNITGDPRFLSCMAPSFALGVQNVRPLDIYALVASVSASSNPVRAGCSIGGSVAIARLPNVAVTVAGSLWPKFFAINPEHANLKAPSQPQKGASSHYLRAPVYGSAKRIVLRNPRTLR